MSWITLRLSDIRLKKILKLVRQGYYPTKTEFIRMAIRDLLEFHFKHKRKKEQFEYNFVVEYYEHGYARHKGYRYLGSAMRFARRASKNSYAIILDKNGETLMEFANGIRLREM